MKRTSNRRAASPLALFALTVVLSTAALAATSKQWRANNHSPEKVKVFWTAAGCAGHAFACDASPVVRVCKSKALDAGEEATAHFDEGTSDRAKGVCRVGKKQDHIAWTKTRKKNGIRLDSEGKPEWYDD